MTRKTWCLLAVEHLVGIFTTFGLMYWCCGPQDPKVEYVPIYLHQSLPVALDDDQEVDDEEVWAAIILKNRPNLDNFEKDIGRAQKRFSGNCALISIESTKPVPRKLLPLHLRGFPDGNVFIFKLLPKGKALVAH